jgi:hypothetical protein
LKAFLAALFVVAAAGCASYDGRNLSPGASVEEVDHVMGKPALVLKAPEGGEVRYYTRAPEGRHTFSARFGADGRLLGIEQRLTKENFAKVVPGKTTRDEVRELLGPPAAAYRTRDGFEEWDYRVDVDMRWFDFLVDFSDDAVVRKAYLLHDPVYDTPGPGGGGRA